MRQMKQGALNKNSGSAQRIFGKFSTIKGVKELKIIVMILTKKIFVQ